MIRINRVWSEENRFKELVFKPGINFIVGENSKDKNGNVNEQRNGSGKSLSIELINFVLMKRESEGRIHGVPDSILPQNSFVYMNLTINGKDVTVARNKKNEVLMKVDNGEFQEMSEKTAKDELANISGLGNDISFRELCNFVIKESNYSYSTFLYFFPSNVIDRLRTSLYFFGLPVKLFEQLRSKQDEYDSLSTVSRVTIKKIEDKGLDINKLRSLQSDLEERIVKIEQGLSYDEISKEVSSNSSKLQEAEDALTDTLRQKGRIEYQLSEIEEFLGHQDEDTIITDKQLQRFFNKYIAGLGDFVQRDLEQLKKFRDEIHVFEAEMLSGQEDALRGSLARLENDITTQRVNTLKYQAIITEGRNHLQRGLKISHELINDFNDNGKLIETYDEYDQNAREVNSEFQTLYSTLEAAFFVVNGKEVSFRKTFLDIHEKIYGNKDGVFAFDLSLKRNIKDKEFFKIKAEAHRQGSEGVNRVRQIIYDLSLLVNEHTSEKMQKLLVHDRLLFGDIDNDATFNIVNYIHSLDENSFQYIATYNSDVMPDALADKELKFDVRDRQVVKLSVSDPLFYKQFKQAIDYEESKE
ncbi:MAG: hypothetical protein A2747_02850 [Candidatus Yonathbacteria bacterium RIFCSPHIGHO2_01_FULL_44_41]|uniref:DUF2326 domain-containing protein n=1 Tax=Candidatus Yonathbacteria bacterium RIFCSPHIGHO2_02_FULL_44_14 TaxID=1802724 RepID=A0A1G2S626_9BACT|nr:MAG: hypothetical protein A2747_02850 [Candidatus Yonathbacteria bacterium RIFCSPHIGHO2_01_FULL_44_41]OHA80550.1 MAG: hypothetical protein A3D51_00540 [Candidatus Yonathbacteria bacterium RIFCSPHIGHO2_02_FULL_44_14]OHA82158.1 MAG: hypothetical protein A3B06_01455 [Candidatus Yonathbacteria bacterium RIFCSPLOWO2_01_FULL_43_20]